MKPVELEIFLQDGLTPGLKNAGKTVGRFASDTKKQLRDVSEALKIQRSVVSALEKECRQLEKALAGSAPGAAWAEAKSKLTALQSELAAEKAGLVELTNQQRELKLASESAGTSLRQQLRNVREEIATLLLAYRSLSEAEKQTAQGKELARHIDELTEKAGELNDAIADTTQAVTNAASDSRGFDQLAGGIQLVVDGFGLATAGAQALGLSESDLMEVQTQLQTALVASNALTSMQVNLQKQSALMQGVNAIQTKAAATAENLRTWAVGRGVIATKAATVAQAAFNSVARANPYVVLAAAVVTVVGALYALAKGNAAAKKAEAERQQQMEKARGEQEEFARTVASAAGEQIASFLKLKRAWENLGESFDKKRKFITDTKEEWHKLGKEIDNVNDMERVFRQHTKDIMTAIILRAELKAYETRIQNVADQMVEDIEKNKTYKYVPATTETRFVDLTETEKAAISDRDSAGNFVTSGRGERNLRMVNGVSSYWALTDEGARIVTQMRRDAGNVSALAAQNNARTNAERTIQGYIGEMNRLADQLDATMANIPGTNVEPEGGKPDKPDTPDKSDKPDKDGRVEHERRAAEELQKLRWQNEQDEINQMAEGAERRLRQIRLDYEKERAEIERERKSLAATNREAGTADLNEQGLTEQQQAEIDRAVEISETSYNRAVSEVYDELTEQYQSYADRRLAIEKKYDADIAELTAARGAAAAAGDTVTVERMERSLAEAEKAKGKALTAHDFEVLRQSPEYVRAFEDLRNTSTETLETLMARFEAAKGAASAALDPQDLREYTTTIRELTDELESRDPLGNLARKAGELAAAERELARARRQYETVAGGGRIFTGYRTGRDSGGALTMTATFMSLEDAFENYTRAKERHARASNGYVKAEKDARETVSRLTEAIRGVGDAIGGTAGEITGLILDMGTFVTDTMSGIQAVARTGEEALGAVEKASVILGIASAAIRLLHSLSDLGGNNAFREYEAYAEKVKEINALTEAVGRYRLAVLDARQEEAMWFAEDGMRTLRNWRQMHDEVYAEYVKKASEAQATYRNESGGGWLTGAINWVMGNLSALSWWEEWRNLWGQGGYTEGTTAAINNLRIETRKKSSGFLGTGIGGHSQKTADLVSWARENGLGELFDERGLIDKELARSIIDTYGGKLVGQTRETLEALIDLREKYDEYIMNLHEYVSSLYEPLVNNLTDSLWDWLDEGKDALDSFRGYAGDTFRDIVSDMLRTIVLDKVVGSFSDDISALYEKYAEGRMAEEELMRGVAALTGDLIERYGENIPALEGMLTNVAEMLDRSGIDIRDSGGTSQSGRAGGFAAMSQDQGTKLEGLFTSAQIHLASIDERTEDVVARMNAAEGYLARIAENTETSAARAGEIKELITEILRDGIKTR